MLTSKRKEKISAFLDNDMHKDELMSFSLSAEDEDAAQALRYQLLGDVLRGEISDNDFIDVSSAVRHALVDEELVYDTIAEQEVKQDVIKQATDKHEVSGVASSWSLSSLFRPAAGMAVAASVAVVMVVSFNQQGNEAGIAPVASVEDNKVIEQPVLLANETKTSNTGADQKVNQRLVKQHLEFATQDTLQGRLPYVRAVSFESEK